MSPTGGSESLKANGTRIARSGSLALLFTVSCLMLGTLVQHKRAAGPITAPLALDIDAYFPSPQSAVEKPHAPKTQMSGKHPDGAPREAVADSSTSLATSDVTHRLASVRLPEQIRTVNAGAGTSVAPSLSLARPQAKAASGAVTTAAGSASQRASSAAAANSDRSFVEAFTQAAAPAAQPNESTSSIDRSSLASSAKIAAPETGMGVIGRQTGSGRYVSGGVTAANRVGAVAINSDAQIGHLDPSAAAAYKPSYDAVNVRTSFTVPAFHRPLQVSVGGGYERMLQTGGPHVNSLDMPPTVEGSSAIDGTGTSSALNNAGRLSLNRAGYTTSVTVPVASRLNVGVGYAQRNVNGGAGLAQSTRIDERQHLYTGSVTYQGRSGRSSLMLIGRESRAVDSTATAPDTKIRRGDLVFSVKF